MGKPPKVDYVIYNAQTNQRLTKGYTMQVAVCIESEEMCFVSPKAFTDKLAAWVRMKIMSKLASLKLSGKGIYGLALMVCAWLF